MLEEIQAKPADRRHTQAIVGLAAVLFAVFALVEGLIR